MGFRASCAPNLMIYSVPWRPDGRRTAESSGSTIQRPRVPRRRAAAPPLGSPRPAVRDAVREVDVNPRHPDLKFDKFTSSGHLVP